MHFVCLYDVAVISLTTLPVAVVTKHNFTINLVVCEK